jgi:conjugative transfer signal peptidase TraF
MSHASIAAIAALGVAAAVAPTVLRPAPALLWNATASAPIGFYWVHSAGALRVGDWVAARPPPGLASVFAARRYLPLGVPLVKRIAALPPSRVCRLGFRIEIDGAVVARARPDDRWRRQLPTWGGCRRLAPGQLFLLNAAPDSLDGRYFGLIATSAVIGRLTPVWSAARASR